MYIASLSTIPSRFDRIAPVLTHLLTQEVAPEAVRLYIPRRFRRFPDWDGVLPEVPRGVEICRPEEDLGPATKVVFAAQDCAGQDIGILYCDDDRLYLPDWSRRLLAAQAAHPGAVIAAVGHDLPVLGLPMPADAPGPRVLLRGRNGDLGYRLRRIAQQLGLGGWGGVKPPRDRVRRSGYAHVAEGYGGVLIRSGWLGPEACDIPPVMWSVDDVWLSGHLARAGHPVWVEAGASRFLTTDLQYVDALLDATLDGSGRAEANRLCAEHFIDTYGIWS